MTEIFSLDLVLKGRIISDGQELHLDCSQRYISVLSKDVEMPSLEGSRGHRLKLKLYNSWERGRRARLKAITSSRDLKTNNQMFKHTKLGGNAFHLCGAVVKIAGLGFRTVGFKSSLHCEIYLGQSHLFSLAYLTGIL